MHAALYMIATVLVLNGIALFVLAMIARRSYIQNPTIHHRREHRDRDRSNPD